MPIQRSPSRTPGQLRRRAETSLRKSPRVVADMSDGGVRTLVHELQVHPVELQMQNLELRRAQLDCRRLIGRAA